MNIIDSETINFGRHILGPWKSKKDYYRFLDNNSSNSSIALLYYDQYDRCKAYKLVALSGYDGKNLNIVEYIYYQYVKYFGIKIFLVKNDLSDLNVILLEIDKNLIRLSKLRLFI